MGIVAPCAVNGGPETLRRQTPQYNTRFPRIQVGAFQGPPSVTGDTRILVSSPIFANVAAGNSRLANRELTFFSWCGLAFNAEISNADRLVVGKTCVSPDVSFGCYISIIRCLFLANAMVFV